MSELVERARQAQTVAATQAKKSLTVADYMERYEPELSRALGDAFDVKKFAQDALTTIRGNEKLMQADMRSIFGAVFLAAQLRLPIGGPLQQFHLTPKRVKGEWACVPMVGYQGYIQLAMNTGHYSRVSAFCVYENDYFVQGASSERGEFYDFKRADGDRGALKGVVGYAKLVGHNETAFIYLDAATVRSKHRPSNWERSPWATHEGEMFRKTSIRVLQKYLPKSVEAQPLALAAQADQAVVRKIDGTETLSIKHDEVEPVVEADS